MAGLRLSIYFIVCLIISASCAVASAMKCEEEHTASLKTRSDALNIKENEANFIVHDIASKFGINSDSISVVRCDSIENAQADYNPGSSTILHGEYILYNPTWISNVAGNDKTELYAIFGHELGHLANRHFIKPMLSRKQKELDADRFSGCVAASVNGSWETLEGLLNRLRPEVSNEYPSKRESLTAARKGWDDCKVRSFDRSEPPAGLSTGELLGFSVNQAMNADIPTTVLALPDIDRPEYLEISAGFRPDVLGIRTGMKIGVAEKILETQGFIRTNTKENRLTVTFGTPKTRVESPNYLSYFVYARTREGNISETLVLEITSPVSGSVVFSLRLISRIPAAVSPSVETAFKALRTKYGDPNPDYVGPRLCWTGFKGHRLSAIDKWSCSVPLEYFNMLEKDHVDIVITADVSGLNGLANNIDINLRNANVEASINRDFQNYVEVVVPGANILSSKTSEPLKF